MLECIKILEQREDVISVSPNYYCEQDSIHISTESSLDEISSTFDEKDTVPNDYASSTQWAISKISLDSAWNITTGSTSVRVGILDTGINGDHPDLEDNIISADMSLHRNFVNNDHPLTDPDGHGTLIAGIIGAKGNNGIGITGVCWNVSLISLRIAYYSSEKEEYVSDCAKVCSAIDYAKNNNIKILNYSYSGTSEYADYETTLNDYDGLFVCSAGNKGTNISLAKNYRYPAYYNTNNMICVANSTEGDVLNTESGYASCYSTTYVDLAAPGTNIYSTYKDDYEMFTGTSLSTPYVTGVAALLKSKYPAMKAETIKDYIEKSVDKKTTLTDKVSTGGRLNAYKALNNVKTYTVEYQANGGTGTMADTTVIYKNKTSLRSNSFTRTNYVFKGWNSYRASDEKCYYIKGTDKDWFIEGQQDPGYTKYLYPNKATVSATTSVNGDTIVMTAQWAPKYEVIFNGNDESGGIMWDMDVVFGEPYNLNKNTFYRSNCTMTHWYAKKGNLMYYTGPTGAGWYAHGSQPSGYTRKEFSDEMYIGASSLTDISGGNTITMNAYWEPNYDLLGDFNMDGSINIKDATAIQANLSQTGNLTAYEIMVGDVNFSGSLTVKDVTMVQKYVARQISEFGA